MKLTRPLILAAFFGLSGAASAAPVSWIELAADQAVSPGSFFGAASYVSGIQYTGTGQASVPNVSIGGLWANQGLKVTYTMLGGEAGFEDYLFAPSTLPAYSLWNHGVVGSSVTVAQAAPGWLDFKFVGRSPAQAVNGVAPGAVPQNIGLIKDTPYTVTVGAAANKTFDFVIGYNDSAVGLADWDDMVIGVNIAPIPEPETYAMLLAGLGLMGFVARRRKKSAAV